MENFCIWNFSVINLELLSFCNWKWRLWKLALCFIIESISLYVAAHNGLVFNNYYSSDQYIYVISRIKCFMKWFIFVLHHLNITVMVYGAEKPSSVIPSSACIWFNFFVFPACVDCVCIFCVCVCVCVKLQALVYGILQPLPYLVMP